MSDKKFGEFNREIFKKEYCKSDEQIDQAEKMLGFSLAEYYNHYIENHYDKLDELSKLLISSTFKDLSDNEFVNSMKSRVKDPYHLVDKIVRKILKNTSYSNISLDNYHLFFDDLLGFRLILLYEEDWFELHKLLVKYYELDSSNFVNQQDRQVKLKDNHKQFIISKPEINIRDGDDELIYKSQFQNVQKFTDTFLLKSARYYRSIHYSVFQDGYCFEIQVRSVFDEAWSEVDHNILYPKYLEKKEYVDFSKMINRVTGLSNEMSSYFRKLIVTNEEDNPCVGMPTLKSVPDELGNIYKDYGKKTSNVINTSKTANDIINEIVKGTSDII